MLMMGLRAFEVLVASLTEAAPRDSIMPVISFSFYGAGCPCAQDS